VNTALQQSHEPSADCQAKTATTKAPGGGYFSLCERRKQTVNRFGRHAYAVVYYLEYKGGFGIFAKKNAQAYLSFLVILTRGFVCAELDGVAQQIEQYLPDPDRITHDFSGEARVHVFGQINVDASGQAPRCIADAFNNFAQIRGCQLDFQPSRFDLRKVENIANDPQQGVT